jgi:hypothetical protein
VETDSGVDLTDDENVDLHGCDENFAAVDPSTPMATNSMTTRASPTMRPTTSKTRTSGWV